MINMVNKSKKTAAEKILNDDFSSAGMFLNVGEAENFGTPNFKILISNETLKERAQKHLDENK